MFAINLNNNCFVGPFGVCLEEGRLEVDFVQFDGPAFPKDWNMRKRKRVKRQKNSKKGREKSP